MNFVDGSQLKPEISIMKNFGIADLERFTGIKAHTLRTWEQRFGIPKSHRTETNIRKYSLVETNRMLSIALLNRYGFRISKLAILSIEEILRRLQNLNDHECQCQMSIHRLLYHMYAMNSQSYEKELHFCFSNWKAGMVINDIIIPFLKLTNLQWSGNRLPEEHLVVTILRRKLFYFIDQLPLYENSKKRIVLFLPDTRQLDLSMLCAFFLLKQAGTDVIYMGNDISFDNLADLFGTVEPNFLYTHLPQKNLFPFEKLVTLLGEKFPGAKLLVTFHSHSNTHPGIRATHITSFEKAIAIMCE